MIKRDENGQINIDVAPTVEELIKELKQFNPHAKVRLHVSIPRNDNECTVWDKGVVAYRDCSCVSYRMRTKDEIAELPYIEVWDTDIVEIHSKGLI